MTIGMRLTLWGVLTTLLVCLILNVILVLGMRHFMLAEVDRFLIGELRELSANVREHGSDYQAATKAIREELGSRRRKDFRFRLIDAEGQTLIRSDAARGFSRAYLRGVGKKRSEAAPISVSIRNSEKVRSFRAHSESWGTAERGDVTAVAFYTLKGVDQTMDWFLLVSSIGLGVAVLISLLGNGLLARRSLSPVKAMTDAADAIAEESLGARIERSWSDDEMDRLAQVLNAMLDRLESHVKKVRQFTDDASHELRSPLAALRGSAEVCLSRPRSTEELRTEIENGLEQYDRMQRMSEDLLLLARVDAGEDHPHDQSMRLEDAVQDVVDLYRPLAAESGLDMRLTCIEKAEILGDSGRLRQLLGNLLDNAIKFSTGPGTVEVSLRARDELAELTVTDTGVGIAPDDLGRVFDRFFRADPARSRGGTGLGLAISKWIAEAHGGQLTITSREGQGTMARVTFPRIA